MATPTGAGKAPASPDDAVLTAGREKFFETAGCVPLMHGLRLGRIISPLPALVWSSSCFRREPIFHLGIANLDINCRMASNTTLNCAPHSFFLASIMARGGSSPVRLGPTLGCGMESGNRPRVLKSDGLFGNLNSAMPSQTTASNKPQYSAVSLFSGCGGSDLGLKAAGVEPVWANDVSESACELYEVVAGKNVIHAGSIEGIAKFPKADILAGCYPCQGYSQGGRRSNTDGINFLYQHFDRALRQIKPKAFIVENVDGMRFSQNQHLLNNQLTRFRSAGYRVSWRVLNARDYGLAQNRCRLFIVGIRSSEGKVFEFPTPTHGTAETPYRTMRDVIWELRNAPPGSYNEEPFHWYYLSRNRRHEWDNQSPCVVAHWRHVGLHPDSTPLVKKGTDHWEFARKGFARRFSYLECAALQGFTNPKAFRVCSVEKRFRAIGNAVPPPLFQAVAKKLVKQLAERRKA